MTIKLYEKDSYVKKFNATVISSDENGTVLDKTAFFPEGGGQYGDTGYINGIRVTDTIEKNGVIYHKTEQSVEIGEANCVLDWAIRYNRMQNHSGEHLLSGVIHSKFGYNNVGFHLGDEECTLDVDGKLTADDIVMLENECNALIDEDLEIEVLFPTSEELESIDYRSKLALTEGVRIIKIGDADMCACCAPHVSSSAKIGLIKIVKAYNYKGGTRMHILCGAFARTDYAMLSEMNTRIVNAASAKRSELTKVFERMEKEISCLKEEIKELRQAQVKSVIDSQTEGKSIYVYFPQGYAPDELLKLCDASVCRYPSAVSCAFSGDDDNGYSFAIGGEGCRERFAAFKAEFNARGGGKDIFCGKVQALKSELEKYFE